MKTTLTPRQRYNILSVPVDDELLAHLQASHEASNRKSAEKTKFAPHLRNLWRLALDATAFPHPLVTHKPPRHRKVE